MPAIPVSRRTALAALGLSAPAAIARAQPGASAWPTQPVRYINGYPAGGATDTLSRLYCARMSEITGQQFVVENRSGSGGNVGADAIAKARPDGATIGLGGIATHAIAPTLYGSLPFDHRRDFTLISGLWQLPNMLVVNNDVPARDLPELIALARARPGGRQLSYASAGAGTTIHLAGAMFAHMIGAPMLHVPYRGGAPAMVDVIAGRVDMIFDNIPGALAQARQGAPARHDGQGAQRGGARRARHGRAPARLRDRVLDLPFRPGRLAAGHGGAHERPHAPSARGRGTAALLRGPRRDAVVDHAGGPRRLPRGAASGAAAVDPGLRGAGGVTRGATPGAGRGQP